LAFWFLEKVLYKQYICVCVCVCVYMYVCLYVHTHVSIYLLCDMGKNSKQAKPSASIVS